MAGLGEIRNDLIDQVDWNPAPSEEGVARLDGFLNRAQDRLCLDAPFLFWETEYRFQTQAPFESLSDDDTIVRIDDTVAASGFDATNPYTFGQSNVSVTGAQNTWAKDGSLCTSSIQILNATTEEILHRSVIRDVISATGYNFVVTLVTPIDWETHGDGPFKYRVYRERYFLPGEVIQWRSGRLMGDTDTRPIKVLSQHDVEERGLLGVDQENAVGEPRYVFRRGHEQMPSPNTAPTCEIGDDTADLTRWKGPEPPGSFQYAFTIGWGKQSVKYRASGRSRWDGNEEDPDRPNFLLQANTTHDSMRARKPQLESAPSPASSTITTETMDDAADWSGAVIVKFPLLAHQMGLSISGFTGNNSARTRTDFTATGLTIRLWRRRVTADFAQYDSLGNTTKQAGTRYGQAVLAGNQYYAWDISDAFYLLDEFPLDTFASFYIDDGTVIPDYNVRLRDTHGHQSFMLHPTPDGDYEVAVRVLQRPEKMVNDQDVPRIHPEAVDALINKAAQYVYEHLGDVNGAARAEARYNRDLETLSKRYGDMRPDSVPVYVQPTRSNRVRGPGTKWWRNYEP